MARRPRRRPGTGRDPPHRLTPIPASTPGGTGTQRERSDAPLPIARTEPTEMVLGGRYLGGPGCLDEGQIGGRRAIFVDVSIVGAPKRVRVGFPVRMTWSTDPAASVQRLADRPVAPRVGTAP